MERLKNRFEKFYGKYLTKKEFFQRTVDRWGKKGWVQMQQKGANLLGQADRMAQELKQEMALATTGQSIDHRLKEKVKAFRATYKELYESTKPAWRQWIEAIVIALVLAGVLRHTIFSPYHVPTGSAEPTILVGDRIWGNKMAYYFDTVKHGDLVIFDDPRHVFDDGNFIQLAWQKLVGFPIPLLGLKSGPINVVKRVIAVPGDIIEGKIEDGKTVLYRNGQKLNEPYVNKLPLITLQKEVGLLNFEGLGPITIPDFLRRKSTEVRYTYDPLKPFDKQPYYTMTPDEVVKRPETGQPVLWPSYAPNYVFKTSDKEFFSVDSFGPITLPKDMYWVMGDSRRNSEDSRYWGPLQRKYVRGRASFILFSLDSEEVFWLFDFIKHPIDFWTKHLRWSRFFKSLSAYQQAKK